ncbi:MAG: winged helix-turn-helix domain-containing protein [Candidatus Nanoarchaeia archaeon]
MNTITNNQDNQRPKNPIDIIKKIEIEQEKKPSAQEILEKDADTLLGKRDTYKLLNQLKVILAIALGQQKNKDLAKVLNTDKSFTSKQIKELEEKGLIKKEGSGKETTYKVDHFNVLNFLQSKVVIKWNKTEKINIQQEEKNGRTKETNN